MGEETFSTKECGQLCSSSKMLKVHDLAHFIIETELGITVKNILIVRHFIENKKEVLESKNAYDRESIKYTNAALKNHLTTRTYLTLILTA